MGKYYTYTSFEMAWTTIITIIRGSRGREQIPIGCKTFPDNGCVVVRSGKREMDFSFMILWQA